MDVYHGLLWLSPKCFVFRLINTYNFNLLNTHWLAGRLYHLSSEVLA